MATKDLRVDFGWDSRLERVALRYGFSVEHLLSLLEDAAVDITDPSHGISEPELAALDDAGISLEGPESDPTGSLQVALSSSRVLRFREQALSVKDAAALIGVSPARVRQLLSTGDAVSIPGGVGNHLLPGWQFAGRQLVPGLRSLAELIDAAHPMTVAAFMQRPDPDLEVDATVVSPVGWLVGGGDPEVVARLALRLLAAA